MIETIRLSEQAKDQLVRLKRYTGIGNWNVLSRWAFCKSLAEPSIPPMAKIPADSSVEMTWKVFGGANHELYWALLKTRCAKDGIELTEDNLASQFRLHLHRGIAYLAADKQVRSVAGLVTQAVGNRDQITGVADGTQELYDADGDADSGASGAS